MFIYPVLKQAEDSANLGMAILLSKNIYKSHETAANKGEGITECYYTRMNISIDEPAHYFFYADGKPEMHYLEVRRDFQE